MQINLSGSDVGVQPVFSRSGLIEGAEQPSFVDVERRSIDRAAVHRGLYAGVILGLARIDVELAETQLDILSPVTSRTSSCPANMRT